MEQPRNNKLIMQVIVTGFILAFLINILAAVIFPPDFSGDFPIYSNDWAMLVQVAGSFFMIALTVIAMKAEEEKQILAAAGFTALAISFGINILCLFDIADVVTFEQYERYYRITVSTYFLLIVSTFLIGSYYKFKLWIRYYCIISVIPFLIVSILFLFGVRDYNLLEFITNFGVIMFSLCWIFWAYNIFFNYQKDNKKISEA